MKNNSEEIRTNNLLAAWRKRQVTVNGWLSIPDASTAETMAHAGWDSLTIDMQHGLIDYRDALSILRAISTTDVVPMVRVPWLDEGFIMKMLDAGAYGIICPMIGRADQAQRLVGACRYPPRGERSLGPIRAGLYGGPGYAAGANDEIPVFAMIETLEGMENLDRILDVAELTGIFVGPSDLSLAWGEKPRLDPEGSRAEQTMLEVLSRTKSAGKFSGVFCGSVEYAGKMVNAGANFVSIGSDMRFLASKADSVVKEFRKMIPGSAGFAPTPKEN